MSTKLKKKKSYVIQNFKIILKVNETSKKRKGEV